MEEKRNLPLHVGLIMDGNGRWATQKGLPRNSGHKKGADVLETIGEHAFNIGIKHFTVFAFSTENFSRPKEEVDGIMDLMRSYLSKQKSKKNRGIKLCFIGDIEPLADDIKRDVIKLENETALNDKMTFNIAFNYGGRQDILNAAKKFAHNYKEGTISDIDNIKEEDFQHMLYTKEQPNVDLLIRTSGEQRLSNFLLWQCAYAEFVFEDTLWPDYNPEIFDRNIEVYTKRDRRLGGL